jgi:hypothetical protein
MVRLIAGGCEMLRRQLAQMSRPGPASGAGPWMCGAFCAALALSVVVLATMGTGDRGTSIALQLTGRLSLLIFWPAYAGAATAALFGPRFRILAQHGRTFGLAYASAQLVHFGLVVHIISISGPLSLNSIMPFFAVGIVWTYLLAFSSIERVSKLFSPGSLRILRNVGLEYLAIVFFADLVLTPIGTHFRHPLEYLPFSILIIVAPILRLAAILRRGQPIWRLPRLSIALFRRSQRIIAE